MKTEITPDMIWYTIIAFGLSIAIAFIFGLAKGVKIGREKDNKKADKMAAHFAEWCDDHVSQERERSRTWFGGKLGIDRQIEDWELKDAAGCLKNT